jgi:biotin carboxyl carrier protein
MNETLDRVRTGAAFPAGPASTSSSTSADSAEAGPRLNAAAVLQLQAAVLSQSGFRAAATVFANDMARLFGAARVCLGWAGPGGVSMEAMSGEVDFVRNAELCRILAAAMDESLEQGASIAYPPNAGARPRITLAHAEVAYRGSPSVLTVPLVSAGRLIGAMTLELRDAQPPTAAVIAPCEHVLRLIAPVLELKRQLELPWYQRLMALAHELRERLLGPGHLTLKWSLLVAFPMLGTLGWWPVDYRVSAPAHLEGVIQRILVAPSDGFLRDIHAKPGDSVVAGQVLAELADQDLELERRKWASERAQLENSYLSALAKGERTQYAVNFGKADAARAQLELVEQLIGRSRIRAPFDGIVIKGDLSQTLGAPVQRGDVLLTIAPANAFRLMVEVDERDIADVRVGRAGTLALAAVPDATFDFQVVRVTPVASARDGRNFFEVEGQFQSMPAALRPGLQGVAKIAAGRQSLAWVWSHRVVDWARLAIWSLGS